MALNKDISPAYFTDLLNAKMVTVEPIKGGANSRAFKVTAADGSKYAAKVYPGLTADGRDRMAVEVTALEFLRKEGLKCVPRPIRSDQARQCAVFEFIEGAEAISERASASDIDQITQFLGRLNEFKNDPESLLLLNAAESCFSVRAILDNLDSRLSRLQAVDASSEATAMVQRFLTEEFTPVCQRIAAWAAKRTTDSGASMDSELEAEYRTLSPSDFGLHNAIRRSDGELVFLDFEYFGWDDPAKTISDFLLHPAMDLTSTLKMRFTVNMLGGLEADRNLLDRVESVFPLYGLKWCLIFLNHLLPAYRIQRGINSVPDAFQHGILAQQLEKARSMLNNVCKQYERFPYRDVQNALKLT